MSAREPISPDVADALWVVELLRKIDMMNHAIALHGQVLVDLAIDAVEDDEPSPEVPVTVIMRRCLDVIEWRDNMAQHSEIERVANESLAWQAALKVASVSWLSSVRTAGYRGGLDAGCRMTERHFADTWLKQQPWFMFLCALCELGGVR